MNKFDQTELSAQLIPLVQKRMSILPAPKKGNNPIENLVNEFAFNLGLDPDELVGSK